MSEPGYSASELEEAQQRFGLTFPPDLVDLLREQRIPGGYDWMRDDEKLVRALQWPLEGMLFDVEENDLWWPEWGERPATKDNRATIVAGVISNAPKLIPLMGHRYLPEEPNVVGNPIFSVYQSDIIVYGADLHDWLRVELDPTFQSQTRWPVREIEFWSLAVTRGMELQYRTVALGGGDPPTPLV